MLILVSAIWVHWAHDAHFILYVCVFIFDILETLIPFLPIYKEIISGGEPGKPAKYS